MPGSDSVKQPEPAETVRMSAGDLWDVTKQAAVAWWNDNVSRLGASLSYYTLFSLAPMLVIAIAIAGFVFGPEAARGEIVSQIQGLVGREGARAVQAMLQGAAKRSSGIIATIVGVVTLVVGATGIFLELQTALNGIWRVKPKPSAGIIGVLRQRLISFGLVVGVGFLLLVSLLVSAALAALGKFLGSYMPGYAILGQALNVLLSLAVITLLFAMVYKVLPDVELAWRDVWVGGLVTAGLFSVGKLVIGLYLGTSSTASTYGAAASVIVLLLWVYYSSQIVLLGAEFTRAYVDRCGRAPQPMAHATSNDQPQALKEPGEKTARSEN
jgi:membrane protein